VKRLVEKKRGKGNLKRGMVVKFNIEIQGDFMINRSPFILMVNLEYCLRMPLKMYYVAYSIYRDCPYTFIHLLCNRMTLRGIYASICMTAVLAVYRSVCVTIYFTFLHIPPKHYSKWPAGPLFFEAQV